jgi:hypothetical protein
VRVLSFEQEYQPRDLDCTSEILDNYAHNLRTTYEAAVQAAVASAPVPDISDAEVELISEAGPVDPTDLGAARDLDPSAAIRQAAINALAANSTIRERATSDNGVPWMEIQTFLASTLPPEVVGSLVSDPKQWAFKLVAPALNEIFGTDG